MSLIFHVILKLINVASFARIVDEDNVRNLIQRGVNYGQIAIYYQSLHPNATGMSSRSISRYCNERNIKRITDEALQDLVRDMITLYGHNYGRKMMQGSISFNRAFSSRQSKAYFTGLEGCSTNGT